MTLRGLISPYTLRDKNCDGTSLHRFLLWRENHHIEVLRCAVGVKACFMRGWGLGGVGVGGLGGGCGVGKGGL